MSPIQQLQLATTKVALPGRSQDGHPPSLEPIRSPAGIPIGHTVLRDPVVPTED